MKREIKFRGKSLDNGEWYFGSYVYLPDSQSHHIIPCGSYKPHIDVFDVDQVEVDPDTVGQFIGLTDANGTEIYEGDILDSAYFDARYEDAAEAAIGLMCEIIIREQNSKE